MSKVEDVQGQALSTEGSPDGGIGRQLFVNVVDHPVVRSSRATDDRHPGRQ